MFFWGFGFDLPHDADWSLLATERVGLHMKGLQATNHALRTVCRVCLAKVFRSCAGFCSL